MAQMDEEGLRALARWICKKHPGIPKMAVIVWLTNINEALGYDATGKEGTLKMHAQKLLGEALGVAKLDKDGKFVPGSPTGSSQGPPRFDFPEI